MFGFHTIAVRDCVAFLRYGGGASTPSNPAAGRIDHTYGYGISQCGRFLRHFLSLGLNVDETGKHIRLELTIDPKISDVMEYFEIFMTRMLASRKAAKHLGATFGLQVNGNRLV